MKITSRYLTFETNPNNACLNVNIYDGDELIEQVFTHLGEGEVKYFVDMQEYIGKDLRIEVTKGTSLWQRFPEAYLTEEKIQDRYKYIRCEDSYETDFDANKYRPYVHFTTQRGWINDPNGCLYYDGVYHLYYQHCPGAPYAMWDNNHWGHAWSKDLITWTEAEPILRYPHAASGTGFVNRENGKACITHGYMIYESDDGGYHYKFKSVNTAGNGDPKILFIDEFNKYFSITLRDITSYTISSSPDLVNWQHESDILGFRECPEMVKYQIEGTDEYKWVLNGGDGAYQIGEFNGHEFIPDPIDPDRLDKYVHVMNATKTFSNKYNGSYVNYNYKDEWDRFGTYAHQNFDSAPDGRKIRIAWYPIRYTSIAGMPFNQAMTIPCELKLRNCALGLRLCAMPVDEIKAYYRETKGVEGDNPELHFDSGKCFDCEIEFDENASLYARGYEFNYIPEENMLNITPPDKVEFKVPCIPCDGKIKIRALFDIMIAEFFIGDGEVYVPLKPETPDLTGVAIEVKDGYGKIKINKIKV